MQLQLELEEFATRVERWSAHFLPVHPACPLVHLGPEKLGQLPPRTRRRRDLPVLEARIAVAGEREPDDEPRRHGRLADAVRGTHRHLLVRDEVREDRFLVGGWVSPGVPVEAIEHEGDRVGLIGVLEHRVVEHVVGGGEIDERTQCTVSAESAGWRRVRGIRLLVPRPLFLNEFLKRFGPHVEFA